MGAERVRQLCSLDLLDSDALGLNVCRLTGRIFTEG